MQNQYYVLQHSRIYTRYHQMYQKMSRKIPFIGRQQQQRTQEKKKMNIKIKLTKCNKNDDNILIFNGKWRRIYENSMTFLRTLKKVNSIYTHFHIKHCTHIHTYATLLFILYSILYFFG